MSTSDSIEPWRSSERAPASTPSGDADLAGGWLPSLTFAFDFLTPTKQIATGLQTSPPVPARSPNQR